MCETWCKVMSPVAVLPPPFGGGDGAGVRASPDAEDPGGAEGLPQHLAHVPLPPAAGLGGTAVSEVIGRIGRVKVIHKDESGMSQG